MDGRLPETHPATPKQDTSLASTRRRLLGQSVLRAGHFMRPRQPASVRAPPTFFPARILRVSAGETGTGDAHGSGSSEIAMQGLGRVSRWHFTRRDLPIGEVVEIASLSTRPKRGAQPHCTVAVLENLPRTARVEASHDWTSRFPLLALGIGSFLIEQPAFYRLI